MRKLLLISLSLVLFCWCSGAPVSQSDVEEQLENEEIPVFVFEPGEDLPVSVFPEIWVYVVAGRENALMRGLPLTDIGYYGAGVDSFGKLTGVPNRRALVFSGKVHMVVSCHGRTLSHFTLMPGSAERNALIADLIAATRDFDGLQINFEEVPPRAADAYFTFLQELRAGLPQDKMLSVALAARTRRLENDIYDYQKILPYVDRILVMAYDEHWSGSKPGSVASLDWCRRVAQYSLTAIGREKLIMGLPFYGRAWGDYSPSRALVYTTTERIINENSVSEITYENGIPTFEYNKNVSIRVFFEDKYSLTSRMQMYQNMNVRSVGFWRLGQETQEIWNYLKVEP